MPSPASSSSCCRSSSRPRSACALGAPSDALAGNNGQQIKLCPNLTVSNGFAYVLGPYQNGATTVSPVFALGEASNDIRYQTGCRTINGYWWAGTVNVYWYRSDGRLYTRTRASSHGGTRSPTPRRASRAAAKPPLACPAPGRAGQAAMASTTEETSPRGPWALPRKRPHTPSASAIGANATTASTATGRSRRSPAHPGTHASAAMAGPRRRCARASSCEQPGGGAGTAGTRRPSGRRKSALRQGSPSTA